MLEQTIKNPTSRARLYTVQAIYAMQIDTEANSSTILEALTLAEKKGKSKILRFCNQLLEFIAAEQKSIDEIIKNNSQKTKKIEDINPLIYAILLTSIAEITKFEDTDKPIIISEYLKITSDFFDRPEVAFINAVLDSFVKG